MNILFYMAMYTTLENGIGCNFIVDFFCGILKIWFSKIEKFPLAHYTHGKKAIIDRYVYSIDIVGIFTGQEGDHSSYLFDFSDPTSQYCLTPVCFSRLTFVVCNIRHL